MLNPVSKALSLLFKPVATSKSDADRDPGGSQFERFQNPSQDSPQDSDAQNKSAAEEGAVTKQVEAKVIPLFPDREAQKKAIGISQAWLDIKSSLKSLVQTGESVQSGQGSEKYNEASSRASSNQLSKKGAIVDKKAS